MQSIFSFFQSCKLRFSSKKFFIALAFLCLLTSANAQQAVDIVKTKKGDAVRGQIFHRDAELVKIRTTDGSVFAFKVEEIEGIEQEQAPAQQGNIGEKQAQSSLQLNELGGQNGIVIGFGDGLIGGIRQYLNTKTALEAGLGLGATQVPSEGDATIVTGIQIEAGAHLMGQRRQKPNGKVKAPGIMARVGHLFGDYSTTFLSAGYGVEVFNPRKKKPTRSYIFEAGLKAAFPHWDTNIYGTEPSPVQPYLRFRWTWYGQKDIAAAPTTGGISGADMVQPLQGSTLSSSSNRPQVPRLKKGSIVVATSTGLGGCGNTAGIVFNKDDEGKTTAFSLSPNSGYFFSDGFLGGANINIVSSTEKDDYKKVTTSHLSIGPFVRYYGSLPSNKYLNWTVEAAFGFGTTKYKNDNNVHSFGLSSISFGPGLAYFLSDRVSVEVQGVYERLSTKDKETGYEYSQGSFGLRVGFGVFL